MTMSLCLCVCIGNCKHTTIAMLSFSAIPLTQHLAGWFPLCCFWKHTHTLRHREPNHRLHQLSVYMWYNCIRDKWTEAERNGVIGWWDLSNILWQVNFTHSLGNNEAKNFFPTWKSKSTTNKMWCAFEFINWCALPAVGTSKTNSAINAQSDTHTRWLWGLKRKWRTRCKNIPFHYIYNLSCVHNKK